MWDKAFLAAVTLAILFGTALNATAQTAGAIVVIKTTKGDITVELDPLKAPVSVKDVLMGTRTWGTHPKSF